MSVLEYRAQEANPIVRNRQIDSRGAFSLNNRYAEIRDLNLAPSLLVGAFVLAVLPTFVD
jgi:hypothetical protein